MRRYLLVFMLLFLSKITYSQDFQKDWKAFLSNQKEENFFWEINLDIPSQNVRICYFKKGTQYYYKYNDWIEWIWNTKEWIGINHQSKQIRIQAMKNNQLPSTYPNADSLAFLSQTIGYQQNGQGQRIYTMTFDPSQHPQIQQMVYYFSTKEQKVLLDKIMFYSHQKKDKAITMSWNYLKEVSSELFQKETYIDKNKQATKYKGYALIEE